MELKRFISSEGLPRSSGAAPVQHQNFSAVGQAIQQLGHTMSAQGKEISAGDAQAQRRAKAEEDLDVSKSVTRFKSISQQTVENKRKAYSPDGSFGNSMATFQPDTVKELKEWAESPEFELLTPTAQARFKTEAYSHIESLIPELGKMSSELIVQGSEHRLGEARISFNESAVNAADSAGLEKSVTDYGVELDKAVMSGMLSKPKAQERLMKFHEDVSRDWFERKAAMNPESMYRALHSTEPNDRRVLAQVDGKAIAAFVKNYGEQQSKDFKGQSAARLQATFPLAVRGNIVRRDLKDMAEYFTTEDFNKIQGQVDKNEQMVNENIKAKKTQEDDDLKKKQSLVENNFWDQYFSNPGLVNGSLSAAQDRELKILEPTRYEKVRETLAKARDVGGLGDEKTMNLWKVKLFHNSNALNPDQILGMNNLNYSQRQELFAAKRTQEAFEKEGSSNAKHFSNDPNYKFYSGAIQEQLGIIKLSPFTNASSIQVLSQAEVSYREEFKRLVDKNGSVSMEEAKQLMTSIVGIARQNIGFKSQAMGEMPRYQDSQKLHAEYDAGRITDKEFIQEWEKLKAWRAVQGMNPDGTPMEDAAGSKPKREFSKHGKE